MNSTLHGTISPFKLDFILICFPYFSVGVVIVSVSSPSGTPLVTSILLSRIVLSCESANIQCLITLFTHQNHFISAKMEAQDNDLPSSISFRISGFPTLKFKRAGTKEFIDYEGDRSYESLISFIEEHAKNSLSLPETEKPKTGESKTEEPKADEAQVPFEVEEKKITHEEL